MATWFYQWYLTCSDFLKGNMEGIVVGIGEVEERGIEGDVDEGAIGVD